MSTSHKVTISLLITVLSWSSVATLFKMGLLHMSALQMVLGACLFSAICFSCLLEMLPKRKKKSASVGRVIYLGALNPFLYYWVLFTAYDRLPAQQAQALNYAWPVLLSVSYFFSSSSKPEPRVVLAYLCGLAGIVLVCYQGESFSQDWFGCTLAVGSALIWSLFWRAFTDLKEPLHELYRIFWVSFGLLCLLTAWQSQLPSVTWTWMKWSSLVAFFEMVLPFICWFYVLRHGQNKAQLSLFAFFSPLISLLWIHYFLKEELSLYAGLGLVLIILSIFGLEKHRISKPG